MRRKDIDLFEVWKPIQGFEGYEVSSYGRVWSNKKQQLLRPGKNKNGYLIVSLQKDGKGFTKYIHRLVSEEFILNVNNLPCVNHKNERKDDNRVENLEWCSYQYNINYGTGINRMLDTNVRNGRYNQDSIGLSKAEQMKKWRERNIDLYLERNRRYAKKHYSKIKDLE